jgi:hypothetical protein
VAGPLPRLSLKPWTAWLEAKADRIEHAIKEGILQEASYNDEKQET